MSGVNAKIDINSVAEEIKKSKENIHLIYAFNGTGKTRLSKAYKDISKTADLEHTGVYYNAYSEDLFYWENDASNTGESTKLLLEFCSLNVYHNEFTEGDVREKLKPYNVKFDFRFSYYDDSSEGINFIYFWDKEEERKKDADESDEEGITEDDWIKISRGEERIFIWCFFLALFEVGALSEKTTEYYFIDDPVSSLDDNNLFLTASLLFDLIEKTYESKKIIVTSHHIGFISTLSNWLTKCEKKDKYRNKIKIYKLNKDESGHKLVNCTNEPLLYHLYLLNELVSAYDDKKLSIYHFVMLRQLLEFIASFLGVGRFSYVLEQLGYTGQETNIINALSHKNFFSYDFSLLENPNLELLEDIILKLQNKYNFK